jgi:hypothetical protein
MTVAPHSGWVIGWKQHVIPVAILCAILADLVAGVPAAYTAPALTIACVVARRLCKARAAHVGLRYSPTHTDSLFSCYGNVDELDAIGHYPDVAFEPYIVSYPEPFGTPGKAALLILLFGTASTFVYATLRNRSLAILSMLIVVCGYRIVSRVLFCQYYRILPGKLDVLSARPGTVKIRIIRSIALDDAKIVCRFDKGIVEIDHKGPGGRERIDLRAISNPWDFVEMLYRGAVARPVEYGVPCDELTG